MPTATITMDDGSAVILSVAKYYTPDGKSIQDNGVTPNEQVVETDSGLGDSDDDSPDADAAAAAKKPTEDVILKKAIEVVKTRLGEFDSSGRRRPRNTHRGISCSCATAL